MKEKIWETGADTLADRSSQGKQPAKLHFERWRYLDL